VGQAFQIQDDIIGIFDTQKNIGKSILSDIAESKKTILVCHAYKKLIAKEKSQFIKHFTKPKKTYKDLVAIRKIFISAGSLQYSLHEVQKRIIKSFKILHSLKMRKDCKQVIEDVVVQLFKHSTRIAQQYGVKI